MTINLKRNSYCWRYRGRNHEIQLFKNWYVHGTEIKEKKWQDKQHFLRSSIKLFTRIVFWTCLIIIPFLFRIIKSPWMGQKMTLTWIRYRLSSVLCYEPYQYITYTAFLLKCISSTKSWRITRRNQIQNHSMKQLGCTLQNCHQLWNTKKG